jgi:N-acetylmuramoyl-L-alanine amidase
MRSPRPDVNQAEALWVETGYTDEAKESRPLASCLWQTAVLRQLMPIGGK